MNRCGPASRAMQEAEFVLSSANWYSALSKQLLWPGRVARKTNRDVRPQYSRASSLNDETAKCANCFGVVNKLDGGRTGTGGLFHK